MHGSAVSLAAEHKSKQAVLSRNRFLAILHLLTGFLCLLLEVQRPALAQPQARTLWQLLLALDSRRDSTCHSWYRILLLSSFQHRIHCKLHQLLLFPTRQDFQARSTHEYSQPPSAAVLPRPLWCWGPRMSKERPCWHSRRLSFVLHH